MLSQDEINLLIDKYPDACFNFIAYWENLQKEYDKLSWWQRLFKENPQYTLVDTYKVSNKFSAIYSKLRFIQNCVETKSAYLLNRQDLELVNYWSNYHV